MAKVITLSGVTFNNPSLPRAIHEPLMSNGSILMLDPTHPMNPWPSGVPADGLVVPNLAINALKALVPTATETQINGEINNAFVNVGRFERSGRGGLHGIIKQNTYLSPLESNGIFLRSVREYIAANASHAFFIGLYGRITRADTHSAPNAAGSMVGMFNSGGTDYLTIRPTTSKQLVAAPSASRTDSTVSGSNVVGDFRVSGGFANLAGTPSGSDLIVRWTNGHQESGSVRNASWILYNHYIEDLTVSGRTYAQVQKLYADSYTKEVLTLGGRYYGDTYTDPATVV